MNDEQANALFEQSVALLQQGKAKEALKYLARLDQAIPSNPGILYFTATAYSISGNKHKAIQTYERVLRLNPQFIEAYNNIALDLSYLGEHQRAIAFVNQALTLKPDFIEALVNKGCLLNDLGEFQLAQHCFESALHLNHSDTMALANLSVALRHLGEYDQARACAELLLQKNPEDYKGHTALGKIFSKLEDYESALKFFLDAQKLNPSDPDLLADLGATYSDLGNHSLAHHYFREALSIKPDHGASHLGLGSMHLELRNFDQAFFHLNIDLHDKKRVGCRQYNRAITHLHAGNLKSGWADYILRWKESELPVPYLQTTHPQWEGQITTAPVLIWHEQGIGDQILFGTLFSDAAKQAPNLIIRMDERLVPLFHRSFPGVRFISHDQSIADNDFQYHCPIGDLARFFRNNLDDFKHQPTACLKADNTREKSLRDAIGLGHPVIGLAWVTKGKRSKERNLPIDDIVAAIQSTLPATLIDLQYSDTTEDLTRITQNLGITIQHLDAVDNFNDIDGLAALISACDFVVTCSNTTAHLAGALGKETYLLVPFGRGRHWYWSHISEDGSSMWYPSIRVIPQTIASDWTGPLDTLRDRLLNRHQSDLERTVTVQ